MTSLLKPSLSGFIVLVFFLIYPLDLVFYGASSRGWPSIPVGFIGNILLSFFILLIPFFLLSDRYWSLFSVSRNSWFLITLVTVLFVLIVARVVLSSNFIIFDFYFWWINFTRFILGFFFAKIILDKNIVDFKKYFIVILLSSTFLYSFPAAEDYNYLRSGDSLLIVSILLLFFIRKFYFIFIIFIVALLNLYVLDSRAALFLYLIGSLIFFIRRYPLKYIIPFILSITLLLIYYLNYLYSTTSNINSNRLVRIIFEKENDTSFISREAMHNIAVEVFLNKILIGDYAYYRVGENIGHYSHDYWSFLAEFGLLGVLIVFSILILALLNIILSLSSNKTSRILLNELALIFSILLIVGIVFAKSYSWGLLYFIIGFLVFRITNLRSSNSKPNIMTL